MIMIIRSGANDATRATNKQYVLQKSSYCPIRDSKISQSFSALCFDIFSDFISSSARFRVTVCFMSCTL